MKILIYLAVYICYLGICATTIYCVWFVRLKKGKELIKPEFSETFSLLKGAIYFAIYWLTTVFFGRLIEFTKNDFLINNANFFAYLFLLIVAVSLFYKFFYQSFKNAGKNIKNNVISTLIIWAITFVAMIAAIIVIAVCRIENKNQNSLDDSQMNMVCKFFSVCLFGPVVEELVFRGILFRWLREYTTIFAYVASGLFFGLEHGIYFVINYGDFLQLVSVIPTVIGGIGYAIIYDKTKNIIYPIVLHILFNLIFGFLI